MENQAIIGIDVSKRRLDVTVFTTVSTDQQHYSFFSNDLKGFKSLLKWVKQSTKLSQDAFIICMEHTGIYTLELCCFLEDQGIYKALENSLQIKRSLGIQRGKNDKIDSAKIAEYAFRFRDKLKSFKVPSKALLKLRTVFAQRDRLMKAKISLDLGSQSVELYGPGINKEVIKGNKKIIDSINQEIQNLDKLMVAIIESDPELLSVFNKLNSVPCIGVQSIVYFLIVSNGGVSFESPRNFACYCGVAPFEYRSGTSIRGKTQVSYLANRRMKELLHMASLNAVRFIPELKDYYERKAKEGKNPMSILNAIKFKIICRMFAVLNREEPYQKDYSKKAA
jgi:transposase